MSESDSRFFDDLQRRTIEAAMARIIPTDHEPGAREAGAIDFLDRYLSGIDFVYANPDRCQASCYRMRRHERLRKLQECNRYVRHVAEPIVAEPRFLDYSIHLTGAGNGHPARPYPAPYLKERGAR